jgi:SAM-dependent methyltransferase
VQRVSPDDPEYRRLASAEAAFWDQPQPYSLESLERVGADGPIEQYVNARYMGHPDRHWWDAIPAAGPFRRGLVLGTSSMTAEAEILANNSDLHLTFVDISPGALARRADEFGRKFPGRVATVTADLNFVELARGEYDLVVSAASLHHITNLEYLAEQIATALRPSGRFFLQDYVGEPRFQFSAEKKRAFEAFHDGYLRREMPARTPGLVWWDSSDLSPFCGVRSDEVLGVLGARLAPVAVRTSGALIVPLSRVFPVDKTPPGNHRCRAALPPALRIGRAVPVGSAHDCDAIYRKTFSQSYSRWIRCSATPGWCCPARPSPSMHRADTSAVMPSRACADAVLWQSWEPSL